MSNKYPGGIITSGANAGYSVFFDGSGDYLTGTTGTATQFSGNFTVEAWIYVPALPSAATATVIFASQTTHANATGIMFGPYGNTGAIGVFTNNAWTTYSSNPITANAWWHVALVRSGTTVSIYTNGTLTGSFTSSQNYSDGGIRIGTSRAANNDFSGYISNLRVNNSTALYTANFTPPTQLLANSGITLLTCNSPAIVDQSSNAITLTPTGTPTVSTFTPFTGYTAYNPALGAATPGVWTITDALQAAQTRRWNMYDPYFNLTTLLLHGNGTNGAQNNTFLDSSSNNFTITRNGNTTQGTFSPFSQTGWSNFFNGSSYLQAGSNAALAPGSGNFTVEFWVFPTAGNTFYNALYQNYTDGLNRSTAFRISINNADATSLLVQTQASALITTSTGVLTTNAWNHVALVRNGSGSNNLVLYVNGVSVGTVTNTTNFSDGFAQIGNTVYNAANYYWNGYISNLRVVPGTAVYTAAFTPPTSPLTAISGTALLTCQSNRFIDNSSNALTITPNGTPSVQVFSPFLTNIAYTPPLQGGSGYFDGTGDFLTADLQAGSAAGTGEFFLSCWIYITGATTDIGICQLGPNATPSSYNNSIGFATSSALGGRFTIYESNTESVTGTVPRANTWFNFAMSRNSLGRTRAWINGVETWTFSDGTSYNTRYLYIGGSWNGSAIKYFTGYISGFQFLSGAGSGVTTYPTPTVPPTVAATTRFLCNFSNAGIVDSTAKNVLETVSSVQVSTTQSKFGGSSMWFQAGGTLAMANSPNLSFGTGDFTVEWWVYWNTVPTASVGFVSGSGTGSTDIRYDGTNLRLGRFLVAFDSTFAWTAVTGQWYHVAVTRQGTSVRAFVNGTQIGTTSANSNTYNAIGNFYVGTVTFGTPGDTPLAYIDDFRITKGYARYTANFTPQTSQWQDQ